MQNKKNRYVPGGSGAGLGHASLVFTTSLYSQTTGIRTPKWDTRALKGPNSREKQKNNDKILRYPIDS